MECADRAMDGKSRHLKLFHHGDTEARSQADSRELLFIGAFSSTNLSVSPCLRGECSFA
jgi:hypothetical protein